MSTTGEARGLSRNRAGTFQFRWFSKFRNRNYKRLHITIILWISLLTGLTFLFFGFLRQNARLLRREQRSFIPSNPNHYIFSTELWRAVEAAAGSADLLDLPEYQRDPQAFTPSDCSGEKQEKWGRATWQDTELKKARDQWKRFVQLSPTFPEGMFQGRGVVICAGGPGLLTAAYINLRMLRRVGHTLPVEIWHYDDETPGSGIVSIFERYGAVLRSPRQVISYQHRSSQVYTYFFSPKVWDGKMYQLKAFAILFSSFEEVLFLDADNMVVSDLQDLFTSFSRSDYPAVFWRDFWLLNTPPVYWDLLELPIGFAHNRSAVETGQMLYHKRRAWKSMLLALAFNMQAKIHYWMPTAGECGAGDKETFPRAFDALKETSYLVSPHKVEALGSWEGSEFRFAGIVQHNPFVSSRKVPLLFHAIGSKVSFDMTKSVERRWGSSGGKELFGFDAEFQVYDYLAQFGCEVQNHYAERSEFCCLNNNLILPYCRGVCMMLP